MQNTKKEIKPLAFLAALSLIIFLGSATTISTGNTFQFDNQIATFFYHLRTPFLTSLMKIISFLGFEFTFLMTLLITILLLIRKKIKEALLFSSIIWIGGTLNLALKLIIARPRPAIAPLIIEKTYSFPSGHAMNSFIFYLMSIYLVYHFSKNQKNTYISITVAAILIILIGISRIYLGVHYPSDIIAGYLAGLWWLTTIILIHKILIYFKKPKH